MFSETSQAIPSVSVLIWSWTLDWNQWGSRGSAAPVYSQDLLLSLAISTSPVPFRTAGCDIFFWCMADKSIFVGLGYYMLHLYVKMIAVVCIIWSCIPVPRPDLFGIRTHILEEMLCEADKKKSGNRHCWGASIMVILDPCPPIPIKQHTEGAATPKIQASADKLLRLYDGGTWNGRFWLQEQVSISSTIQASCRHFIIATSRKWPTSLRIRIILDGLKTCWFWPGMLGSSERFWAPGGFVFERSGSRRW